MSKTYHITREDRLLIRTIRAVWLAKRNCRAFELFLREWGFRFAAYGAFKVVTIGRAFVVKWDSENDGDNHTDAEARQHARARPHKRRYLAKTLLHLPGLLIQERLPVVHHPWRCPRGCPAEKVAHRLRIMDWMNHGQRADGSLCFFDSDSQGSGWYNWRSTKKGRK